jgi:tetratricopeptide (TPR) repeat protein
MLSMPMPRSILWRLAATLFGVLLAIAAHATETADVLKKIANGEYAAIVSKSTEALQSGKLGDAERAAVLSDRAGAYSALGRYAPALEDANAAIRLKPDLAEAYFQRANASFLRSDFGKAAAQASVADLTTAIRLKPDYEKAYRLRGSLYELLERSDEELADYDSAIRVAPNSAAAYVERAGFFSYHQDHAKAIADYTVALRLDPNDAFVYWARGANHEAAGHREEAIADYRKALALDPDNGPAAQGLANLGAER